MRLWSLHPALLDRQGLVACWREALLAQAVLLGRTRGYTHHPQLERFRSHACPAAAIGAYLSGVHHESVHRGYRFNADRIVCAPQFDDVGTPVEHVNHLEVTYGQLDFEWSHLQTKLAKRSPDFLRSLSPWQETPGKLLSVHPMFSAVPGPIAAWERGKL